MRLLIVEDDPDGREMLAELFRMRDWVVTTTATRGEGLSEMRAHHYDVIISDEDLLGESGSSMLREAEAEGLLGGVGAVMYTAESSALEVPLGVRVLRKPLSTRILMREVDAVVPEAPRAHAPPSS